MPALTPAQHNILLWLNDQGDRVLYGPMADTRIASPTKRYGFAGGGAHASAIRLLTGDKLKEMGLIRHVRDKYPLGYYAITEAGRQALAQAQGHPALPGEE